MKRLTKEHRWKLLVNGIRDEVYPHFLNRLRLMRLERTGPGPWGCFSLEQVVGQEYADSVEEAVGEFADLLTQALLAGRTAINREARTKIFREAMRFSEMLREESSLVEGIFYTVLKVKPPSSIPASHMEAVRSEIAGCRDEWGYEVMRKINLRCLISRSGSGPSSLLPRDELKIWISLTKGRHSKISQIDLCGMLDEYNDKYKYPYPLPESWAQRSGERTWSHSFTCEKTKPLMKRFLSGIKATPPMKRKGNSP